MNRPGSRSLPPGPRLALLLGSAGMTLALGLVAVPADLRAQAPPRGDAANPAVAAITARGRGGDLARSVPFDRLTLTDNSTIEVEPVTPRPLPVADLRKAGKSLVELEEMAKKAERARQNQRGGRGREAEEPEEVVIIHALEGEPRDFKVKRASIRTVDYFEDMLMADSDRLIAAGDYTKAFERLLLVKLRDPAWKGLDDAVNRLLFAEGGATLLEDDGRGLRLLNDLLARKPDYPGLVDQLVAAFHRKIDQAIAVGDFFVGRQMLREMVRIGATHRETIEARGKFVNRARTLAEEAARAAQPAARLDRLAEALRVWPEAEGADRAYAEAFRAAPTIRVRVDDLPDPVGPFAQSPAAERAGRLLYLPVIANDDEAALRGEAAGQLLAGWKLSELGRNWRIDLKPTFRWSDDSRPAGAIDLARALADHASPGSPGFNARWADLLDRVAILDEYRLEVRLTRSTSKPETWLLEPVGPAHAGSDGWVSSAAGGRRPVGDGPFTWRGADAAATTFEAAPLAPPEVRPHLRRIVEQRAAASLLPLAAQFRRGEIDVAERVPLADLPELAKVPDVRVGTYKVPSVHRLALDSRTRALGNRKLRRALSMAIDRATLLGDQVIRAGPREGGTRAADAPFVRGSFVADPNVAPLEYQPVLARGLVAAAIKELGGNPIRLTLEHPASPEARATVPKLVEMFRLIGVEVQAIERPESALEAGLRSGRRFDLAYRASRPTDPLRDAGPLLIPAYDAPPSAEGFASAASPRILQLLIDLDRAPESQAARRLAVQIDHESRDELPVIPLWQVEDHYAWRSNVRGPAPTTDHLYEGVTTWEADPWLAKDP